MVYQGTSLSTTQNILTMQCSWTSTTRFERRLHLHRCTTGLIFEAIKKILEGKKKGKWVEVMPQAVRSHNTTVCRATNFLPFWLMYGAEAVLPEEVKQRSLIIATVTPACSSEAEEKYLLESDRLKVVASLQKYQEETRAWRAPKVKLRDFDVDNLVLL
jgi:hypothetical protein